MVTGPSATLHRFELRRHDLVLQPRQHLLALEQTKPEQSRVVNLTATDFPKRKLLGRPVLVAHL